MWKNVQCCLQHSEAGAWQGNVALKTKNQKKKNMLIAFLSLMHAAICIMYIVNIEMHVVERLPNFQMTIFVRSFSFTLSHSAPHHLTPAILKCLQILSTAV